VKRKYLSGGKENIGTVHEMPLQNWCNRTVECGRASQLLLHRREWITRKVEISKRFPRDDRHGTLRDVWLTELPKPRLEKYGA